MLDIHKVKPVHGWREFIGEVGIIVLGVLIALALEQAVEFVHWRIKVSETMDAVRDSAANHIFAATEQQMAMPCIAQQLNNLETKLLSPGAYHPVALYTDRAMTSYVVRIPSRGWSDSVWNTIVTEGVSTHYEHDDRYLLDMFYNAVAQERELAHDADDLNSRLNTLSRSISKSDAMVLRFTETIESLRGKEELMTLISHQIINYARYAKIIPPTRLLRDEVYKESGTLTFCQKSRLRTNSFKSLDFSALSPAK